MPLTLITGGTRGIGAATARRLAADGHGLVLGYRSDEDSAQALAAELSCSVVRADLTDADQVDALFDAAAEVGALTGVVSNAGGIGHMGDLADLSVEAVRSMVEVNLVTALLVARRAVRDLGDGGVLVNVSSGAATIGSPHEFVPYAAAKAGVDTLTLGLAKEVADRGIRVNGVAPGLVVTDLHAAAGEPRRPDRIAPTVPMQRAGEPEEIAAAIAWLLSPESSYVTGATLRVAGGR